MNKYIGNYTSINIACSKRMIKNASSGGVVTTILINALEKEIIDAAIVIGMNEKRPYLHEVKIAKTKEEIIQAAGSKYVLIDFQDILKKIKENKDKKLAVIGLPCHIRILKKLKEKNVKLLIGLFCGYNMPLEATSFLLKRLNIKLKDIKELRYRGGEYPGGFFVKLKNGKTKTLPKHYYDFLNLMYVPKECLNCKDYTNELADVSVGDSWGYNNCSLMIIRNKIIKSLTNNIKINKISEKEFLKMHWHNIKHKKQGDSTMFKLIRIFLKTFKSISPIHLLGYFAKMRRIHKKQYWYDKKDSIFQRTKKEYQYITHSKWTLKEVGRHWDETTDYDDVNERTYSYFRRFIDGYNFCTIPDKSYILDVCSRTGNGSVYFHKKGKIKKVVCADVTEKMQKICYNNLTKEKIDFETNLFSSFPLDFPDNEFDAIICFETLEHIYPPDVFVQELGRVLKPGGELLLTCPNVLWEPIHWLAAIFNIHHSEGPHRFRRRKNILKMFELANLKIEKEKTTILIPGGPKFLIKFGEWFEKKFEKTLMPYLGLRRIFICRKKSI